MADVARRFRVSRTTVYKWLRRFDDGDCLEDRRSVAASFPTRITRSTERKIEQLRRKRGPLGWQIASVLGLARSTVIEVLKRFGLARLRDLEPPRMTRRYEYMRPGELVHIDIKKPPVSTTLASASTAIADGARRHWATTPSTLPSMMRAGALTRGSTTARARKRPRTSCDGSPQPMPEVAFGSSAL